MIIFRPFHTVFELDTTVLFMFKTLNSKILIVALKSNFLWQTAAN